MFQKNKSEFELKMVFEKRRKQFFQLRPFSRGVIVGMRISGKSLREIAVTVGCSLETVKRAFDECKRMGRKIENRGVDVKKPLRIARIADSFGLHSTTERPHRRSWPKNGTNPPVDQQYYPDCGNIAEINKNSILQIQYYR